MSDRFLSGGGRLIEIQLFLLYNRISDPGWCPFRALYMRIFVPLWLAAGSSSQNSGKKLSTERLKPLTYLKYAVLFFTVIALPALVVNDVGMGDPFFCKYLCPQGVLEGAIPLSAVNPGIRSALGHLFTGKLMILIGVFVLSVLFYRPFCKWICPLGAFYALMNKVSLLGIKVDEHRCISCGACRRVCQMDVDVTSSPNHTECIRCGKCINVCPTDAVSFCYGFASDSNRNGEKK